MVLWILSSKSYQNKTIKANSNESIFSEIEPASCRVVGACSLSDANSSKTSLIAPSLLIMALIASWRADNQVSDNFFTTNPFLDCLPSMTSQRHGGKKSVDLRNNAAKQYCCFAALSSRGSFQG